MAISLQRGSSEAKRLSIQLFPSVMDDRLEQTPLNQNRVGKIPVVKIRIQGRKNSGTECGDVH
jgi:hypothetical protein